VAVQLQALKSLIEALAVILEHIILIAIAYATVSATGPRTVAWLRAMPSTLNPHE